MWLTAMMMLLQLLLIAPGRSSDQLAVPASDQFADLYSTLRFGPSDADQLGPPPSPTNLHNDVVSTDDDLDEEGDDDDDNSDEGGADWAWENDWPAGPGGLDDNGGEGVMALQLHQLQQQEPGARRRRRRSSAYSVDRYIGNSANVSLLLDRLMKGYDKRLRPSYHGVPVEVGVSIFVISVSSVSEVNMDFTLDFYFRQYWRDDRLQFSDRVGDEDPSSPSAPGGGTGTRSSSSSSSRPPPPDATSSTTPGGGSDELCISNEMLDRLWWPDTFFANAKQARFHEATTKNAFLRLKQTGDVSLSLRLTVTAMCRMDLTFFPMDSQICSLEVESYAYSVKHIAYKWKGGPLKAVGIEKAVQLPQFTLKGHRVQEKVEVLSTGNYSRLACQIFLVRNIGYYVIHIYVPSSLIVVLSWVSFWLHRDAAPARVSLGITTVLTMTTLISSTNASLPKISYLKGIDVYLETCFVMVFAAILEYAAVSYIANWKPPQGKEDSGGGGGGTRRQLADGRGGGCHAIKHGVDDETVGVVTQCRLRMKGARLASPLPTDHALLGVDWCRPCPPAAIPPEAIALRMREKPGGNSSSCRQPLHASTTAADCGEDFDQYDDVTAQAIPTIRTSRFLFGLRLPRFCSCLPGGPCCIGGLSPSSDLAKNIAVATAIDRYSRVLFPLVFSVLSSIYWTVYLTISSTAAIEKEFVLTG